MKTKTVTVNVTAEDIQNGRSNSARHCPFAKALTRSLGRRVIVNIHNGWTFNVLGLNDFHPLPAKIAHLPDEYDRTGKMRPVIFKIEVPT